MHKRFNTESYWEQIFGFSRAVETNDTLLISKTGPERNNGEVDNNMYDQTKSCLNKIERVLMDAGYAKEEVVYSKMYITTLEGWEMASQAHGEFYNEVRPAFSLIHVNDFPDSRMLVAIEALAKHD